MSHRITKQASDPRGIPLTDTLIKQDPTRTSIMQWIIQQNRGIMAIYVTETCEASARSDRGKSACSGIGWHAFQLSALSTLCSRTAHDRARRRRSLPRTQVRRRGQYSVELVEARAQIIGRSS